jgi:molybdopterin molybdotransferase
MIRQLVRAMERAMEKEASPVGVESIPVAEAFARVSAKNLKAERHVPAFDISALDGFACKGAGGRFAVRGALEPGERASVRLKAGEALFVPTGAAIPAHTRFAPREYVSEEEDLIRVFWTGERLKVWQKGYWLRRGERVATKGERITPRAMELLSLAGYETVEVFRRPAVAILSTGNELKKGVVPNSNRYLLMGLINRDGGDVMSALTVSDDEEEIKALLDRLSGAHLIIATGGTAKGRKDMTLRAFEKSGARKILHDLPISPGKTMTFGKKGRTPFFILPGNPRALRALYEVFVRACLLKLAGRRGEWKEHKARVSTPFQRDPDMTYLVPATCSSRLPFRVERIQADEPDCLLLLESGTEEIRSGEEVDVLWVNERFP